MTRKWGRSQRPASKKNSPSKSKAKSIDIKLAGKMTDGDLKRIL